MKSFHIVRFIASCLLMESMIGCRSAPQPCVVPAPVQQSTNQTGEGQPAPSPAMSPQSANDKPAVRSSSPVDVDKSAGVRGRRTVNFVVRQAGSRVVGANLTVVNAKDRVEVVGTTDEWGEFHPELAPGRYRVKLEWQGQGMEQSIQIVDRTQDIDLSLPSSQSK